MNKLIKWLLLSTIAALLFYCSFLVWNENYLSKANINSKSHNNSVIALNSLSPLSSKPLLMMMLEESKFETLNPEEMVNISDRYLYIRPLDAEGWLLKSLFQNRMNDVGGAKKSLATAHKLAKNNVQILPKVLNRYLGHNDIEKALLVSRDLVLISPSRFRSLFHLMTRLEDNYSLVVEHMIPRTKPISREGIKSYQDDFYFSWALADAIRSNNEKLASVIWQSMPLEFKYRSDYGLKYLDFIFNTQNIEQFKKVWFEQYGEKIIVGEMPKQNFAADTNRGCWGFEKDKSDFTVVKSILHNNKKGFSVEFLGQKNIAYHNLTCLVTVEPGDSYKLEGKWRGENITTLSGPYFEIFGQSTKPYRKRSESKIGSWPWSTFSIEFNVPDDVSIIKIRLKRSATLNLDSKISGTVSFSDVKLSSNHLAKANVPISHLSPDWAATETPKQ